MDLDNLMEINELLLVVVAVLLVGFDGVRVSYFSHDESYCMLNGGEKQNECDY